MINLEDLEALYDPITALWLEEFTGRGACGLCGNSGIVDTRGRVFTAAGMECGIRAWCICPNGRAMKEQSGGEPPA